MKKQYLYAGISIFLWSTTATISKLLLASLDSMQILLVSSLFATIFLLIINLINGNMKQLKEYKFKDYIQIAGIGILGTFLYNLFLYLGIAKLEASQAFVINYLWPIMILIFACIILKEKMEAKKFIAIILSFIGVIIVSSNGDLFHMQKDSLLGTFYCIIAAISYGLFSVLNKKKSYNKFVSMMLFYFVSFVISLVYILVLNKFFTLNIGQFAGLLWIGIFTSAIAFTTWALALDNGDTAKISNLAYITPFLSLVWTSLILKETFNIFTVIGLVFIVGGVLIQLKDFKKGNIEGE